MIVFGLKQFIEILLHFSLENYRRVLAEKVVETKCRAVPKMSLDTIDIAQPIVLKGNFLF